MSELVKIGINITAAGLALALLGIFPKIKDNVEKIQIGGIYISLLSIIYRINKY